ncbi:Ig-specific serine endopeptidase MIP [Metamycoplasma alkalescens]|uniref:Putative peptidase DUF31 n=2 Tax=Metamycoplasma alkalescens TaxID=45363 RepID=A0A318U556_9BACT|nr:DUF31 family protein [Metamycoplasma alkalescens]PYF43077.1 putative peptidase DUF31 [Metamycoplasma alkalescens]
MKKNIKFKKMIFLSFGSFLAISPLIILSSCKKNIKEDNLNSNLNNQDNESKKDNNSDGNNSNNFNEHPNDKIQPQINSISNTEIDKYIKLNQDQRFKKDNDKYVDGLKKYLAASANINNWNDLRKNLHATQAQINNFDKLASQNKQDSFVNSAYKGFTIPSYKSNSTEIDGLDILESEESPKQASKIDAFNKNNPYSAIGLARKIVNEKYLEIAKQTYSIRINNLNDYQKEIKQNKFDINYLENNTEEFEKLKEEKLEKLKKDKDILEKEFDQAINKISSDSRKSKIDEKNEALKKYDENIAYYQNLTKDSYLEFLKKQIEEFKEKAKKNKEEKKSILPENGTMWILDYQIEENKKYPTKWYFGTNSHVAKALTENLLSFSISKISNDLRVGSQLRVSSLDDNIITFGFTNSSKEAISKIFDGTDFLKEEFTATNFLSQKSKNKFPNLGSFVDFAVFEIDFSKIKKEDLIVVANDQPLTSKYVNKKDNDFAENLAKEITNDYVNNVKNHVKFKKDSYLKDYKKIDYPIKGKLSDNIEFLYAVGWPSSLGDFYLKPYVDDDQNKRKETSFSLWTNTEYEYYDLNVVNGENAIVDPEKQKKYQRGNFLSYQIGYRSFTNKPGVLDTFIAAPKFGKEFYTINGKQYANMGLAYMPRRWAPIGGASGSSIRNQHNELVAVYYATNTNARVGLSVAFRSEGFDYQGLYGKYNLPQYDLIYGGGKDQRNSYREALKNKKQDIKTNLFKEGVNKENPDYKFDRVLTAKDIKN